MPYLIRVIVALFILTCLQACSKPPAEEQIMQNIKAVQVALENKNTGDVLSFIDDNFSGSHELDKQQLRRLLAAQFLQHKNIQVNVVSLDIRLDEVYQQRAYMDAAVIATGGTRWLPDDGRIWKLEGEWTLTGDGWKLYKMAWK